MNQPSTRKRRPPQISISFMMLLMVVCSVMSAGLFYASRVPSIQDEFEVLVHGRSSADREDVGRLAHITFIMFTFTSPLILAGLLSTALAVMRWQPAVTQWLRRHPRPRVQRWFSR